MSHKEGLPTGRKVLVVRCGFRCYLPLSRGTIHRYVNPQMETNSIWFHMGIFESPCPFPYGNHQMETVIPVWKTLPYGDFYLNPQMGTNSIRKRVSD